MFRRIRSALPVHGDGGDDGLGDSGADRLTLAKAGFEGFHLFAAIREGATLERLESSAQNLTGVEVITLEFAILKRHIV